MVLWRLSVTSTAYPPEQPDATYSRSKYSVTLEINTAHILLPGVFEDSLSWRKTRLELDKRTALCPIRGVGAKYEVPFPSWSWLTWKTSLKFMLDLVLHALPKACLMPEIEFFHLDIDGKVKRLMAPVAEADCDAVDRSSLLAPSGS
jgi:hypothetical protein